MILPVIWIIEKPKTHHPTIANCLIGNYPIRLIASIQSLQKIIKANPKDRPDLLIVDLDDNLLETKLINDIIDCSLPSITRIFVSVGPVKDLKNNAYLIVRPIDGFGLCKFIRSLISTDSGAVAVRGNAITYKDILLEYDSLKLQTLPDGSFETLSPKEARLLRLFIESSGKCVSRQHIQETIWQDVTVAERTIDSHVSRLRKRLTGTEVSIESVYGGGYILR